MPKKVRILLTGGGSGGHIIPNLVVASAIKKHQPRAEIFYIASRHPQDKEWLKNSGFKIYSIFAGKWRRYFSWQNFLDPLWVLVGFFQSLFILIRHRPQAVFSKGGYVTLPVVMAAYLLHIRIILHESDSRMGLANRLSARLASTVCVAFETLAHGKKFIWTGNPTRSGILEGEPEKGYELTGFNSKKPVLLVWGGSLGAQQINELLWADLPRFLEDFQVVHITGKNKLQTHRLTDPQVTPQNYAAFEYLNEQELASIYSITNLMVSRAGANSLFEMALLQKPNLLVPLLNADQLSNARAFEKEGGSLIYKSHLNFFDQVQTLWQNEALRKNMTAALKKMATPDAAEKVAKMVLRGA